MELVDQLRFQPVSKRIRASYAGSPVLDSTQAALEDHLCFYAERTDLVVDEVHVPRPGHRGRRRATRRRSDPLG
jgi:hypothetical protein